VNAPRIDDRSSYRRILKATSIVGGASVVNILMGLARVKVLAILLGPTGVGLMGLYTNLVNVFSGVAGMGLANSATRALAASSGTDAREFGKLRSALTLATLLLGLCGAGLFIAFREIFAVSIGGGGLDDVALAWLGLAVLLSVAGGTQVAELQASNRISLVAWHTTVSAILTSSAAVAAIWFFGADGLIAYILAGPVAGFIMGYVFVARAGLAPRARIFPGEFWKQVGSLAGPGLAFVGLALVGLLAQLWIRTDVQRRVGVEALGHFQASWTVSTQYVGLLLGAMLADYYPRLSAAMARDPAAARQLVNHQIEIALLISGPVLAGLIAFAPWVVALLYSEEFGEAVGVLRLQLLGDVIKIGAWPLGIVFLASGEPRVLFLMEAALYVLMATFLTWLLPILGVVATGAAFLAAYTAVLPLTLILAARRGVSMDARVARLFAATFVAVLGIAVLSAHSMDGVALSALLTAMLALSNGRRLYKASAHGASGSEANP
jgi:O-antigen/teichoic acid export membrane protein